MKPKYFGIAALVCLVGFLLCMIVGAPSQPCIGFVLCGIVFAVVTAVKGMWDRDEEDRQARANRHGR